MSNLTVCFNAIAPIMLIMALGYLAKSMHAITRTDVQRMNSAAFKYLMPLMLYYNIYSSDLSSAVNPRLIIFGVCGILAVFSVCLLLVRAAKLTHPLGKLLCLPAALLLVIRFVPGVLYQLSLFPLAAPLPFITGNLYSVIDALLLGLSVSALRQSTCPEPPEIRSVQPAVV